MKNYLLLLAVAATVSLTSCDDDDDVVVKSKSDLLATSSWKISTLGIDSNNDGTVETDLTSFISACSKDDILTFKTDKTFTYDEGATKCNTADPQVYDSGTWALSGDESKISFTSTGSTDVTTYNIIELTEAALKYSETQTDSSGTYSIIGSLTH